MGMSSTRQERLIMSILNRLRENFSEGKSTIPVVAASVLVLLSTSAFAFDKSKFEANPNNVSSKAVTYQNIDNVSAMTVTLDYSMRGSNLDWNRRGTPGFAQRWQINTRMNSRTPSGSTGWYSYKFYVENSVDTRQHTIGLNDFISVHNESMTGAPPVSFQMNNNDFALSLSTSDKSTCKQWVSGAKECKGNSVYWGILAEDLKGRWVEVVYRIDWSRSGSVAVWIDSQLIAELHGDVRQSGTQFIYKVGSYRHHMHKATERGIEIKPAVIHYADIEFGSSCSQLQISCDNLQPVSGENQANNLKSLEFCNSGTCHRLQ